jgi:hypothetical protein
VHRNVANMSINSPAMVALQQKMTEARYTKTKLNKSISVVDGNFHLVLSSWPVFTFTHSDYGILGELCSVSWLLSFFAANIVVDPDSLDPDPAFRVYPDTDPDSDPWFRISMMINWKNTALKKLPFLIKNFNLFNPRPP